MPTNLTTNVLSTIIDAQNGAMFIKNNQFFYYCVMIRHYYYCSYYYCILTIVHYNLLCVQMGESSQQVAACWECGILCGVGNVVNAIN